MREIKFRVWDKIGREMVLNGELANGEACAISLDDGIIFSDGSDSSYKKYDMVVMQYTGLKDRNGKEIYEGDICIVNQYRPEKLGVVKWYGAGLSLCEIGKENPTFWVIKGHEIIGNIYENPELLGGDRK